MNDQPQAEMPRYKCHKIVHALKIERMDWHDDGTATLIVSDGFVAIVVDSALVARIRLGSGPADDLGYYVVYADGYVSWSPTKAFEDGYDRMQGDG